MSLSANLRAARNERGLTLESASAKSNVALRYVRMFEDGNYPMVSDPAYLTGFVRRYAACLGLNELEASNAFIAEIVNRRAVTPNAPRRSGLGFSGASRPRRSRPRRFKFYAGPLSVVAVLWTVGPLSPLNYGTTTTAPSVWVESGVRPVSAPPSRPPAPLPALTTEPPAPPEPLPLEPLEPPPSLADAVLPAPMDGPVANVAASDQAQESPPIVSSRSETDKASDALRAAQLVRMRERTSSP